MKINYQDINLIVKEFTMFISNQKESTQNMYIDIVKEYLLNEVCNQVGKDEYEMIFSSDRLLDFQQNYRRSKVVRAALKKLKDYFIKDEKLEKKFDFEYEFLGRENKISKSVIPLEDIRNIVLGSAAKFRNQSEKIATQCMSAICYFCIFEQRHIRMLKCSDVLIDEQRIRNVRVDDKPNEGLIKWIHIGKDAIKYITKYIEYFDVHMFTDELFFRMPEYGEFDNGCQNNLFSNYKFKENGSLAIGSQTLNYSRIYHYLVATKGNGIADILSIVGFSNEQLKNALREYTAAYGVIYNPNNIVDLLDFEDIDRNYRKAIEVYDDTVNIEEGDDSFEYEENWVAICNSYSEENDIGMDDLLLYDSMNDNNQKTKDVELLRLVRSTYLSENLKLAYNYTCQLCGIRLMKARFDAYAEVHHIRPYNKIHRGDDTIGNMIVLCPNCHAQFDSLYYAIHPNTKLVYCQYENDRFHLAQMNFIGEHQLEEKYLTYTWKLFKKK